MLLRAIVFPFLLLGAGAIIIGGPQRAKGKGIVEVLESHNNATGIDTVDKYNSCGNDGTTSTVSFGGPRPRVFFLFMTRGGIDRPDLWEAFFAGAQMEGDKSPQYRAFIHCTLPGACKRRLRQSNPIGMTQVQTVPTTYCHDLVSAMVQLLRYALPESTSPCDKFLFISDSTLPMKPFSGIYNVLSKDRSSDFCLFNPDKWPTIKHRHRIVKHDQWVVLNREHATIVSQNWPQIRKRWSHKRWQIPVLGHDGDVVATDEMDDATLCTDEWALFASIYGALTSLHELDDPTRHPRGLDYFISGKQGACRTFAFWDDTVSGAADKKLMKQLADDWPHTSFDCDSNRNFRGVPKCGGSHPVEIEKLSNRGAMYLRKSPFLFARKFKAYAVSKEEFTKVILSP